MKTKFALIALLVALLIVAMLLASAGNQPQTVASTESIITAPTPPTYTPEPVVLIVTTAPAQRTQSPFATPPANQ